MLDKPLVTLTKKVCSGDRAALARAISIIEAGSDQTRELVKYLYPNTGKSYIIGVTGSPGAGKSTLVDALTMEIVKVGKKVAVVAIDPSSPFSGGAVLGDRVRMINAMVSDHVFIRSMASRGSLGGVAPRTTEVLFALDAAGFDFIIVETVGVGQGEFEIINIADCIVVVLVPGMGDTVQAMKAGILEVADLFVINKADYSGAEKLEHEIMTMLALGEDKQREVSILKTIASQNQGLDQVFGKIEEFRKWSIDSGELNSRRAKALEQALYRQISETALKYIVEVTEKKGKEWKGLLDKLFKRELDPYSLSNQIIGSVIDQTY